MSFSIAYNFIAIDKFSSAAEKMKRSTASLNNKFKQAGRNAGNFSKKIYNARNKIKGLGKTLMLMGTLPLTAFGALSLKAFADFEQGVINVKKTTGLSFNVISKGISDMSKRVPIAVSSLFEIAGAAGQLGVKGSEDIMKFTETFGKLEKASDIAGEEGAKAIVRLLNITGDGIKNVDRFSAAIVDLGNNSAASESEILWVATRVGQATAQFKIGSQATLGIATAMRSLGINAEAGGTVVGKAFLKIQKAVDFGGKEMRVLQKITGKTDAQIRKTFKETPSAVFFDFIRGMKRLNKQGVSTTASLKAFGLTGDRVNQVIPTMVEKVNILKSSMERSSRAYAANIAHQVEFEEQAKSFNSSITRLRNNFTLLNNEIGKVLAPTIEKLGKKIESLTQWFTGLSDTQKKWAVYIGIVTAALGPLLLSFGVLLSIIPKLAFLIPVLKGIGGLLAFTFSVAGAKLIALLLLMAVIVRNWTKIGETMTRVFTEPLAVLDDFIEMLKSIPKMFEGLGVFGTLKELFGFGGMEPIKVEALEKQTRTIVQAQALKPYTPAAQENKFQGQMDINIRDKNQSVESVRSSSIFGNLNLGISGVGI